MTIVQQHQLAMMALVPASTPMVPIAVAKKQQSFYCENVKPRNLQEVSNERMAMVGRMRIVRFFFFLANDILSKLNE